MFSFRYDAHLVPDLLYNIAPMVDGWISWDDRHSQELYSDEPARRQRLLCAARDAGADWVLAMDPDERLQSSLASAMSELTSIEEQVVYSFPLREMYSPTSYRMDGLWGQKKQGRLFRLPPDWVPQSRPLHTPWNYLLPASRVIEVDFNLYHLKMITAKRRRARAALYQHLDPGHQLQPIGYGYLDDERDAAFEQVGTHNSYTPVHEEDGGLWMPAVSPSNPIFNANRT